MKRLFALLFLPSLCFADRLGSLRSSADVLLTTQTSTLGTFKSVAVGTGSVTGYTGTITSSSSASQVILFDSSTLTSRFIGGTTVFIGINAIPAASITAGSLGASVIASSLSVNSVYPSAVTSGVYGNITGLGSQGQALNMGTQLINNVVDPASAQDAATRNYVDTNVNSLYWKQATRLGTTAALPANTYANGASGVGATLTEVGFGALVIDGVTPSLSDRVLVKNEVTTANNGIYGVTAVGSVVAAYVLTRTVDYNQTSEVQAGDSLFITSGTTLADSGWIQVTTGTITMGSSPIVFNQFTGLGQVTAGYGLTTTGNVISLLSNTTSYIQNRSTLQSGTTAYPDFLYVNSSATIANPSFTSSLLSTGTPVSLSSGNVLISSSGANLYAFTSTGTFTFIKPVWAKVFEVKVCGGGGGAAGGEGQVSSTQKAGGAAGGGGACNIKTLWAYEVPDSTSIWVGTGGAGGTGGTGATGAAGVAGSTTTFGVFMIAYGGGAAAASNTTSTSGGSGGGWCSAGGAGATGTSMGGCPQGTANLNGMGGGGAGTAGGGNGKGSDWGGASGGGTVTVGNGTPGGFSSSGGSGGGGAGGVSAANSAANSASAGPVGLTLANNGTGSGGGGALPGTSGATCTNGTPGPNGGFGLGGAGGGAGGANSVGAGCNGGNGGICGGGGGGGGGGTNTGGNGGNGGSGCVYILAY